MSGTRCAFVHPDPWMSRDGKCGRFVSRERVAKGDRFCSVHDPKCKQATRAKHVARMQARKRGGQAPPATTYRERLLNEIAELAYWWDGPGSEGRCV